MSPLKSLDSPAQGVTRHCDVVSISEHPPYLTNAPEQKTHPIPLTPTHPRCKSAYRIYFVTSMPKQVIPISVDVQMSCALLNRRFSCEVVVMGHAVLAFWCPTLFLSFSFPFFLSSGMRGWGRGVICSVHTLRRFVYVT